MLSSLSVSGRNSTWRYSSVTFALIPIFKYCFQSYSRLNGRLSTKTQAIFDLLKIVHILYLDKLYGNNNWIVDRIAYISQLNELIAYKNLFLNDIRMETESNHLYENSPNYVRKYDKPIHESVKSPPIQYLNLIQSFKNFISAEKEQLIKEEDDIKAYHSIVMAINIGWNLRSLTNWKTFFRQKLNSENSDAFNAFLKWTRFYVQVFHSTLFQLILEFNEYSELRQT